MHLTTALIHALPFADRRVCSREEAASYVGVSPGKFDRLVASGTMPAPLPYGRSKRWDKLALDRAVTDLASLGPVASRGSANNEWDEVLVDGQERPAAKRH